MGKSRGAGRPPASSSDKAGAIVAIASQLFASKGYEKTTIRLVAERAGVDPKLVMHYFESKQKLFIACLKIPVEAEAAIALTKTLPKSQWGTAIADLVWEIQSKDDHPLISMIRASASDPEAAKMLKEFYLKALMDNLSQSIEVDNRELRLKMISSLVSGYTFTNKVLGLFEESRAPIKTQKLILAKTIQEILTVKI